VVSCDEEGTPRERDANFPSVRRQERVCVSSYGDADNSDNQKKQDQLSPMYLVTCPKSNEPHCRKQIGKCAMNGFTAGKEVGQSWGKGKHDRQ
jgi:hypothetical protein